MTYQDDKWKKRFQRIAKEVSTWSKDPSTQVGAVIVGDKGQIISQGFNGFARGIRDTEERLNDRETKYNYTIHAEKNAIYNAAFNNASIVGSTMYVVGLHVCHACADAIIQCGIKHVVMEKGTKSRWKESTDLAIEKFDEAGVTYEFV